MSTYGVFCVAIGIFAHVFGWGAILWRQEGIVSEFSVMRQCAASAALVISGSMALLMGAYALNRPSR